MGCRVYEVEFDALWLTNIIYLRKCYPDGQLREETLAFFLTQWYGSSLHPNLKHTGNTIKDCLWRSVSTKWCYMKKKKSSWELWMVPWACGPSLLCWTAFKGIFVFVFLKVKDCYSPLLYESQQLLIPLEELEKQMTAFYDSLGKINEILAVLEHEAQSSALFKQKHQVRKIMVLQEI